MGSRTSKLGEAQRPHCGALVAILANVREDLDFVEDVLERCALEGLALSSDVRRYLDHDHGARVRAGVLLLSARALGGAPPRVRHYAAAMELIHTAAIVHDDVVDSTPYGWAPSPLAGELHGDSLVLLGDHLYIRSVSLAVGGGSLEILALFTNITGRMIEGQILNVTRGRSLDISEGQYLNMIGLRSAHLVSGCAEIGAILAGADRDRRGALASFGRNLGMALRLGEEHLVLRSGTLLSTLRDGRLSLPLIYALDGDPVVVSGIHSEVHAGSTDGSAERWLSELSERKCAFERARQTCERFATAAKSDLETLPESPYREALYSLADFAVGRFA